VVQWSHSRTDPSDLPTFVNFYQYFRQTTSFGHPNARFICAIIFVKRHAYWSHPVNRIPSEWMVFGKSSK
jgi:hypothetical protein